MNSRPPGSSTSLSIWIATTPSTDYEPLRSDVQADVAIVGGGITGLTAAWLLARAGASVVLVERGRIAMSETGHTTAHVVEAVDADYGRLLRDHGEDDARLNTEAIRASIRQMASIVEELALDCDFRAVDGFLFTEDEEGEEYLDRQRESLARAGVEAERVSSVPLPFPNRGGLRFRDQRVVHVREYLLGVARAAAEKGARICESTTAVEVEAPRGGGLAAVRTEAGSVRASNVLLATHVPMGDRGALWAKMHTTRSYVVAGPIERERIPDALFWDTARPYHYIRRFEHEGQLHAIVGGEDRDVGAGENDAERYEALESWCRAKLGMRSFTYRWSGQINEPADALPFIGESSHGRRIWMATGYSGTGMTYGTLGGMLLADLALDRESRFARLYDPGRVKARAVLGHVVTKATEVPKRIVEKVTGLDVDGGSVGDVREGEGRILSIQGTKVAVSRVGGVVREVDPTCTHMGCTVTWNAAETSWDCPCHGSRFASDGALLNGPATTPLRPARVPVGSSPD
jgi:glycine/D-amino acid oxidase-like deaminating enzyme/nitrite reductase/ring-hydroxylating ferredoxin subunit